MFLAWTVVQLSMYHPVVLLSLLSSKSQCGGWRCKLVPQHLLSHSFSVLGPRLRDVGRPIIGTWMLHPTFMFEGRWIDSNKAKSLFFCGRYSLWIPDLIQYNITIYCWRINIMLASTIYFFGGWPFAGCTSTWGCSAVEVFFTNKLGDGAAITMMKYPCTTETVLPSRLSASVQGLICSNMAYYGLIGFHMLYNMQWIAMVFQPVELHQFPTP